MAVDDRYARLLGAWNEQETSGRLGGGRFDHASDEFAKFEACQEARLHQKCGLSDGEQRRSYLIGHGNHHVSEQRPIFAQFTYAIGIVDIIFRDLLALRVVGQLLCEQLIQIDERQTEDIPERECRPDSKRFSNAEHSQFVLLDGTTDLSPKSRISTISGLISRCELPKLPSEVGSTV